MLRMQVCVSHKSPSLLRWLPRPFCNFFYYLNSFHIHTLSASYTLRSFSSLLYSSIFHISLISSFSSSCSSSNYSNNPASYSSTLSSLLFCFNFSFFFLFLTLLYSSVCFGLLFRFLSGTVSPSSSSIYKCSSISPLLNTTSSLSPLSFHP